MNSVIETILAHRSIRKFTDKPIAEELLMQVLNAGRAASTSSLLQAVSIIRITDKILRDQLSVLAGHQQYVAECPEFLVFIIDYQRHASFTANIQADFTELTLIGAIDAGIMGQNCMLAAESLGLGGVFIGGLRNSAAEVDKLLRLPPLTAVLFGLCLGYPEQNPELKPRLPLDGLLSENNYQSANSELIERYDSTLADYYATRSSNTKQELWSKQMADKLSKEARPHMLGYLQSKGLAKR